MGYRFLDQYSLLHFASGIIAYFFKINFEDWFLVHVIFEILENTPYWIKFIDEKIKIWPGGKKSPDTFTNSIGDQLMAVIGWLCAYYLDKLSDEYGWYDGIPI